MLFLLYNLMTFAGELPEPTQDMEIVVTGNQYKEIYVAPPIVKQDGKKVTDYDYEPVVFSKMILHQKTANYYYDANISSIYNNDTIIVVSKNCDYNKNPYLCSNKNDHWVLKTDIQITAKKAYIAMVLFDENMTPVASSTVSKKLKREIIPTKQQNAKSIVAGNVQGVNINQETSKEEKPIILNFPAIIDATDVSQAIQLLYSNL